MEEALVVGHKFDIVCKKCNMTHPHRPIYVTYLISLASRLIID